MGGPSDTVWALEPTVHRITRLPAAIDRLAAPLIAALALRVLYLFAGYIFEWPGAQRFKIETWALILIAVGLGRRLTVGNRPATAEAVVSRPWPAWAWPLFCAGAIILYWPALSVGLLSDDYVLLPHAADWNIGPVTPSLFRPLPLLVWAVVLHGGGGAATLHLLNVLLHGTNAYLTTRVVFGWFGDRRWSVLAGLLMLTAPLAPEAVVWLSGVFDLMATALVLACILVARRYSDHPVLATRVLFVATGLAAVASKETAAVAGGLVLLDAWARNERSRQLLMDTGVLLAIVAAFAITRLNAAFGLARPPLTQYVVQRAIFGTFGGLAVPWHIDVSRQLPWLPVIAVATILCLLVAFFLERTGSTNGTRIAVSAALWVLLPVVPVFPILFVAPDLQQSRYLYQSGVGWAALIVVIASGRERRDPSHGAGLAGMASLAGTLGVIVMLVLDSYGTVAHLQPWREAARRRDQVETSARASMMETCSPALLFNLPDSVRGAYLFRNGGVEAFARDLRLHAAIGETANGRCSFRWDDSALAFVRGDHD
jgi:hypothetical protein